MVDEMSIQRCFYCDTDIDTDFDAEHFDSDEYECIIQEQYEEVKDE